MAICIAGKRCSAKDAATIGLVDIVTEDDELAEIVNGFYIKMKNLQ